MDFYHLSEHLSDAADTCAAAGKTERLSERREDLETNRPDLALSQLRQSMGQDAKCPA